MQVGQAEGVLHAAGGQALVAASVGVPLVFVVLGADVAQAQPGVHRPAAAQHPGVAVVDAGQGELSAAAGVVPGDVVLSGAYAQAEVVAQVAAVGAEPVAGLAADAPVFDDGVAVGVAPPAVDAVEGEGEAGADEDFHAEVGRQEGVGQGVGRATRTGRRSSCACTRGARQSRAARAAVMSICFFFICVYGGLGVGGGCPVAGVAGGVEVVARAAVAVVDFFPAKSAVGAVCCLVELCLRAVEVEGGELGAAAEK